MRTFLARFLPADERRDAIWIAFAGMGIVTAADALAAAVSRELAATYSGEVGVGLDLAVRSLAQAALVLLVLLGLFRLARAPRAISLFVVALQAIAAFAVVLRVPFGIWQSAVAADTAADAFGIASPWGLDVATGLAAAAAVALGAFAAAWLADWVTLAKIRGDEDESDAADGGDVPADAETAAPSGSPVRVRWAFIGWTGRPLTGGARVTGAYALANALLSLVGVATFALSVAAVAGGPGGALAQWYVNGVGLAASVGLVLAAWFAAGLLAQRWLGIASTWLLAVAGATALAVLTGFSLIGTTDTAMIAASLGSVAVNLLAGAAAALAGTAIAQNVSTATLSPSDPQDPDAPASADTAGGSDG